MQARWPHDQRSGARLRMERLGSSLGIKDITLCSWARHFTLTVPLLIQVLKWKPVSEAMVYSSTDRMVVRLPAGLPSIKFAGAYLNTWVKRGTVRVKCFVHLVPLVPNCMSFACVILISVRL